MGVYVCACVRACARARVYVWLFVCRITEYLEKASLINLIVQYYIYFISNVIFFFISSTLFFFCDGHTARFFLLFVDVYCVCKCVHVYKYVRSFGGGKFVALRSLALDQSREHAEFFLLRFFFISFIFSEKRDSEKKSSWSECVYAVRTSVCVHVFFLWGENNFASYSFIQARSVSYTSRDSYSIKFDRQIQFGQHICRVSQYFFSFWKTTFYEVKEVNSKVDADKPKLCLRNYDRKKCDSRSWSIAVIV